MFIKNIKTIMLYILAIIIMGIGIASTVLIVSADTDGNELKITNQPDKLIIQLGADWAGAEFELKLDSGVFPVPVRANSSGVITMELGGSKTYTLTRLIPATAANSTETITNPADITQSNSDISPAMETDTITTNEEINTTDYDGEIELPDNSIPILPLILFLGGFIVAVGVLLAMRYMKKRREYYGNDDDYEYDGEE